MLSVVQLECHTRSVLPLPLAVLELAEHLTRALSEPACKPSVLATGIHLHRLFKPNRVRRRDLAAKGDAFKLFRDMQGKVHRELRSARRHEQRASGDELAQPRVFRLVPER